jgi:hypothetical protein
MFETGPSPAFTSLRGGFDYVDLKLIGASGKSCPNRNPFMTVVYALYLNIPDLNRRVKGTVSPKG